MYRKVQLSGVRNSVNFHKTYFHKITSSQIKKQSIARPPADAPSWGLPATPTRGRDLLTSNRID